ncbi:MAG: hypothetical protein ACYS8X_08480 [Planctomycetota bacterium]|jgi:hypothetical protein
MADEQHEVRQISWPEVFSFSQILKSRKLAMHPSKLILAAVMILLICAGGWVLDRIWSVSDNGYVNVGYGEIVRFATPSSSGDFAAEMKAWQQGRLANASDLYKVQERYSPDEFADHLTGDLRAAFRDAVPDEPVDAEDEPPSDNTVAWHEFLDDAEAKFAEHAAAIGKFLDAARDEVAKDIAEADSDDKKKADDRNDLKKAYFAGRRALVAEVEAFKADARHIRGDYIFASLLDYEAACLRNAIHSVGRGNFTGGLAGLVSSRGTAESPLKNTALDYPDYTDKNGFLFYVVTGLNGVRWLFVQHPFYAIIFAAYALMIWALFGGAIYRIAALQAARDEKISMGQALRFAAEKFWSFFMAPLIPLGVILLASLAPLLGGLLANAWGLGAAVTGLLFILSIFGGLAIAFLLFGLVGGGGLMYPTIAVEGSDSFDGISRSYSYIFNRPWRAGLYGVVATVHGAVCYLFVRFFAFVALYATYTFVKVGTWAGGEMAKDGADKLDVMWQEPTFEAFHTPTSSVAMSSMECVGAFFMAVWVYVVIGLVAAFLVSYFISASTVIYYILRRHVDATDLDDVYVEEPEEEEFAAELAVEAPVGEAPEEGKGDEADEAKGDKPAE